ncbi:MAG: SDR family oxidoreductase [Kiritimatiellae bacterium]|nr:SDR family oxidoreductase [Kiritimatiellia bacterium]
MSMTVNLNEKVAAVTGGGGVLCSLMAKALAANGAKVAVLDLRQEAAQAVADEINTAGGTAIGLTCNVLEKESLMEARTAITTALGPVDILINGAGGNRPEATTSVEFHEPELNIEDDTIKTFFDLDPNAVDFTFKLNFLGTLLPTQVFARNMAKAGSGVIINISSMNAFTPLTKIPAYSGAKAAISNFTQWLAVHFSHTGIRVNALAPGFFLTDQNRSLLTNEDGSPTARGGKIVSQTPMGRYGDPEELIGTLLWLASDDASGFVTGTVIPVDGGFSAYSGV